jgi:hypothetical protein
MCGQRAKLWTVAALLAGLGGCSLVTLKSPERPLSTRDLNARILTREYSTHFIAAVEKSAGEITGDADPDIATNALRWQVGAATQSVRAATQIAPMMGLLDTWALALQMRAFLAEGSTGGALFGQHQEAARWVAEVQAQNADALAERIIAPKDYKKYHDFVETYVRRYPLLDLDFERASIVELWSNESGTEVKLVDTLGTIPEAMSDLADRMKIYGDTLPSQALWKTQLALRDSGYSRIDVRRELEQLDDRMDRMTAVAENAPELVHDAVADVRRTLITIIDKVNQSTAAMMLAFHDERVDLTADIQAERAKALVALDEQRKALTLDAARISDQVVITAGREIRRLVKDVVLLLTLFFVVALGLPFAAGYYVGRGRRTPSA